MSADTFASLWPVLTGEEMLRQMADGRVPMPPHALHAGLAIERVEPGRVALGWRPAAGAMPGVPEASHRMLALLRGNNRHRRDLH